MSHFIPPVAPTSPPALASDASRRVRRPRRRRRNTRRRRRSPQPLVVPGYDLLERLGPVQARGPLVPLDPREPRRPIGHCDPLEPLHPLGPFGQSFLAYPTSTTDPTADRVVVTVYAEAHATTAARIARIWQQLDSEHCPQFLDEVPLPDGIAIVTPWLPCGTLAELLDRRRIRLGEAVTILAPVAQLLSRLSALGAVHGAVGSDHVHFDDAGTPVLVGWPCEPRPGRGDAGQFVELCRSVLSRCRLDPRASASATELLDGLALAACAEADADADAGADLNADADVGADVDVRASSTAFFDQAEEQLFALAEPRAIDPLVPYDWQAEGSAALARLDAEVATAVSIERDSQRPAARLRFVARSLRLMTGAAPDRVRTVLARVRRDGGVRLWPGSRTTVRPKTIAIAAVVCIVASTGALLAAPHSSSRSAESSGGDAPADSSALMTFGTSNTGPSTAASASMADAASPAAPPSLSVSTTSAASSAAPLTAPQSSTLSGASPSASGALTAATSAPATAPQTTEQHTPVRDATTPTEAADRLRAIGADDPGAALSALLGLRSACFGQTVACFDSVDQPGSRAAATDERLFADSTRTGYPPAYDLEPADDAANAQRVGDAAVVDVLVVTHDLPQTAGASPAVRKKPASALLVKGEAGWRVREVFIPPD